MLIFMRIAFVILALACYLVLAQLMHLFDIGSRVAHLGGLAALLTFLVYLFTGVKLIDEKAVTSLRRSISSGILGKMSVLVALNCVLLIATSVGAFIGSSSELLEFDSAIPERVEVTMANSAGENVIGYASSGKSLATRIFSGDRHFRFAADGYDSASADVHVATRFANLLGDGARHIPIRLQATVDLVMRDFRAEEMSVFPVEGLTISEETLKLPSTTVFFTLASPSPSQIWIQNTYVRVFEAIPFQESTFPCYLQGASGPRPIAGFVRISPTRDRYRVETATKSYLGQGVAPSEYHIKLHCDPGYRYRIGVEVDWMDMENQSRTGTYVFSDTLELPFPELLRWEDLAADARNIRVLFYRYVDPLVSTLEELPSHPELSVLVTNDQTYYERHSSPVPVP